MPFWSRRGVAGSLIVLLMCPAISNAFTRGTTAVFQDGLNGYSSTVDTCIKGGSPTSTYGRDERVEFDGKNRSGQNFALLRFDNIFGDKPGQIPFGAVIRSATLTYFTTSQGHTGTLSELLVDWSERDAFVTFGGDIGVQHDEVGADVGPAPGSSDDAVINVTRSLAAWSADPSANKGWIFRPTGGTNGVAFRSSEDDRANERPRLTVTFALPNSASDGFHFTVTADPRAEIDRWNNVLAAMNAHTGGPGAFHVSVGDTDPLQPIRDAIDTYHGPTALWYPLVGNHEAESSEEMAWIRDEYHDGHGVRTPLKTFTKQNGPSGSRESTYSWDYGNAHFIALNQYWDGASDTGTDGDIAPELYDWLAADLAANTKPVVFVFGHEPAFPQYRHVGKCLDAYPARRDRFWDLLEAHHVAAFFVGHTHVYSRTQPRPDGTWQIDVGNAGNDSFEKPDAQTFADVTITSTSVRYDIWRSTSIGGRTFTLQDSWTVPIDTKTRAQTPVRGNAAKPLERGGRDTVMGVVLDFEHATTQ